MFPNAWVAPGEYYEGTHFVVNSPEKEALSSSTVVLVHGIGSYFASFNHVAKMLNSAGYATMQYDFYGRGFSAPSPNSAYDEDIHVTQLENLLSHLRRAGRVTEKIHIVGHSMGGAFVTLFTARFPESILSVTLCTPAGLMKSWLLDGLQWLSPLESWLRPVIIGKSQMLKASNRDFHLTTGIYGERKAEFIQEMILQADNNPHIFEAMWKCLFQFPLNDCSDRVQTMAQQKHIHVVVLWAQFDQMIPMGFNLHEWESALAKGTCSWRSAVIEDAGHMFIIEHAEKVAAEIMRCVQEAEESGRNASTNENSVKNGSEGIRKAEILE